MVALLKDREPWHPLESVVRRPAPLLPGFPDYRLVTRTDTTARGLIATSLNLTKGFKALAVDQIQPPREIIGFPRPIVNGMLCILLRLASKIAVSPLPAIPRSGPLTPNIDLALAPIIDRGVPAGRLPSLWPMERARHRPAAPSASAGTTGGNRAAGQPDRAGIVQFFRVAHRHRTSISSPERTGGNGQATAGPRPGVPLHATGPRPRAQFLFRP